MILDKENEFSDAQDLQGESAGDVVSTNVVDLGSADRDIGRGNAPYFVVSCDETLDSTGDACTVSFELETDADEAFSNPTVLFASEAFAEDVDETTEGGIAVAVRIPQGVERYLRAVYAIGTESPTAGMFSAYLAETVPSAFNKSYPDALS